MTQSPVTQSLEDVNRRLDILAQIQEIVGTAKIVVLAGVDGQTGVALGGKQPGHESGGSAEQIASQAVHMHDADNRSGVLAFGLEQCPEEDEIVHTCVNVDKPQPDPWSRGKLAGQRNRPESGLDLLGSGTNWY